MWCLSWKSRFFSKFIWNVKKLQRKISLITDILKHLANSDLKLFKKSKTAEIYYSEILNEFNHFEKYWKKRLFAHFVSLYKPTQIHQNVEEVPKSKKLSFLGWFMPGLNKYSLTNLFFSKLINNKKSKLSTKKNGSVRTIMPIGNWDKVMPMDILSEYLIKRKRIG